MRGLFLSRECPLHTAQPPVQAVLAFELFDSPRIRMSNAMLQEQGQTYMPLANKMAPAKKIRMQHMEKEYDTYIKKVDRAISRPGSKEFHKEIKYLESMLLYLTQECRPAFKSLIKCDYLQEACHIANLEDLERQYREVEMKTQSYRNNDKANNKLRKEKSLKDFIPQVSKKEAKDKAIC